jgi:hypothetical protein
MRTTLFILTSSISVFAAHAGEMPKAGEDSYTIAYVVTFAKTTKFGDRNFTQLEFAGISTNDSGSGFLHNAGARCVGIREEVRGDVYTRGTCAYTDQDGDQIYSSYEGTASEGNPTAGVHQFVGGVGKYSGMSGKADYLVQFVKSSDGPRMFLARHKATWKLPILGQSLAGAAKVPSLAAPGPDGREPSPRP